MVTGHRVRLRNPGRSVGLQADGTKMRIGNTARDAGAWVQGSSARRLLQWHAAQGSQQDGLRIAVAVVCYGQRPSDSNPFLPTS